MIGYFGFDFGEGVVLSNEVWGFCKLYEYMDNWLKVMVNFMDVLRIVVVKNIVGLLDNNIFNILIEFDMG